MRPMQSICFMGCSYANDYYFCGEAPFTLACSWLLRAGSMTMTRRSRKGAQAS